MKTISAFLRAPLRACLGVGLLLAGFSSPAALISVNLTESATDIQQIDPDETFGLADQGSVVGGWVNLNRSLNASNLAFSDGVGSTVGMSGNPGGWGNFNAAYTDTPLKGGVADYTNNVNPTTITLTNLAANFPGGYKVIVYVGGFNTCSNASISDGVTTFYYQPLKSPVAPVTFVRTTTTSNPGNLNAPVAQYAVFGEPTLLTADSLTLRIDALYGGGAGLGGFQIIGQTAVDEQTRVWSGNQGSAWDTTSLNWANPFVGATTYADGNIVRFDDTALAANPTVNLTAPRSPSSVTVDSTKAYTFTGSAIAGATGLTKKNSGTLVLANVNTYSGSTLISTGTLKLGTVGALPHGAGQGDVVVLAGATLDLNGFSGGINGLSGSGTVDNMGGAATLTVGLGDESSVFGGALQGTVALAKQGTNWLTLTGTSQHTGGTFVGHGTLSLNPASSFSASGALVVSNGATLVVSVTNGVGLYTDGSLSFNGGPALSVDYGNAGLTGYVTPLTTYGTLNLNGVSQIGISGRGFSVGTYTLLTYNAKSGSGSISPTPASLPMGMTATITDTGSAINLVVSSPSIQSLLWTAGDGTWGTNAGSLYWNLGTAEYTEYPNGLGDAVQFDTSNSGTVSLLHDVHPYAVTANGNYVLTGPGRLTGAMGLERMGSSNATFTLSSSNSYDGVTKVTQGALLLTHPGALGSTVGLTLVTNGGSLVLSNGITLAGEPLVLSGDGINSSGALRAVDTNQPVTVASPITLSASARIRADNGELLLTGRITDEGADAMLTLQAGGIGTVRLNSSSNSAAFLRTYGYNLNGGHIVFGAPNVFPTARLRVGGGNTDLNGQAQTFDGIENGTDSQWGVLTNSAVGLATLTITGTNSLVTTVPLAGPIQVVKTGSGQQVLNGTNTHSGTTTVVSGILRINGDSSGATNAWLVSGGALQGGGTLGGAVSVTPGGSLEPRSVSTAIGTLTIRNNLSLAGNVTVELNKALAQSNDVVNVTGALSYGGTLTVTNLGTVPLAPGDTFAVFPPGGTGTFSAIVSDPGVRFSFTDGVLSVVSLTGPTLNYTALGGGRLQLDWTGSSKLQWQTNALSVGLGTNWVDYPGGNTSPVTLTNAPAIPASFFRLAQ